MDSLKILENSKKVTAFYDKEADVLYISLGEPQEAVAVDVGDSAIARYNEESQTLVGITLIGLKQRVLKKLNRQLHVAPHQDGWVVKEETDVASEKMFPTKETALKYAVGVAKAQWLEVVIYDENGKIQEVINPAIDAVLQRRQQQHESELNESECLKS
ncbi:DUF2188 domain-containing protein [Argonema antarcticum]|uniref:DUF2188 domain-containing protein n=1 Tax=Argonema antarcticum TaxID=2942763 RepID=UPI002012DA79|nr:DUF2188 domain-containing protein [Argonema antarcticum]MCL1474556.1 DUF2188 domain-containing protein [Argonema antarcticum A004/B2]